jgi:hypothetical protein
MNRADQSNNPRFETAKHELRRRLKQVNRRTLLNKQTKLFCAACQKLEPVVDVFGNYTCSLACGHRREIEHNIGAQIAKLEQEIQDFETSLPEGGQ